VSKKAIIEIALSQRSGGGPEYGVGFQPFFLFREKSVDKLRLCAEAPRTEQLPEAILGDANGYGTVVSHGSPV
jgi:hypothetical protein